MGTLGSTGGSSFNVQDLQIQACETGAAHDCTDLGDVIRIGTSAAGLSGGGVGRIMGKGCFVARRTQFALWLSPPARVACA